MGKMVVSWSPVNGQSGTTSNSVALASMFALDYSYRSLLTQLNFSSMESLYAHKKRGQIFDDSGMEALERLVKSQMLKVDAVADYTETIYKNHLDLLFGNTEYEDTAEKDFILQSILYVAKQFYDILWIDANSGSDQTTSKTLLKEADLVLVNLPQNYYVIDRFFSGKDFPEELKVTPYFVLISMYDTKSVYSIRNIRRKHKVKVPIFPIAYSTQFKDASNQQDIVNFFYRSSQVKKDDDTFTFIKHLRDVNHSILKHVDLIDTEEEVL